MRPKRELAKRNGQTYFVTSNTAGRRPFFRHERWAKLFIATFYGYRPERFSIHGFVLMPDHFHVLMTPQENLERAVQCVKGGFSFKAKKSFEWSGDIWVAGFSDHRIRDLEDFEIHQRYIHRNPVKAGIVQHEHEYPYRSASGRFELDEFPQGLKPGVAVDAGGAAKAAPFQNANGGDGQSVNGGDGQNANGGDGQSVNGGDGKSVNGSGDTERQQCHARSVAEDRIRAF